MSITFSPATEQDFEEIYAMYTNAIHTMDAEGIHQWGDVYPGKDLLQSDAKSGDMWVGRDKDRPNGIAVAYVLNQECEALYATGRWEDPNATFAVVHRLCVDPGRQGQGIAKEAMRHIEAQARALGVAYIRLDAFTQNPRAVRLYEHMGFRKTGSVHWYVGTFWLMEKCVAATA